MHLTRSRHHKKRSTKRSTRRQHGGDVFPEEMCKEEGRKLCDRLKNPAYKEECLRIANNLCKEGAKRYNEPKSGYSPAKREHGTGSSKNLRAFLMNKMGRRPSSPKSKKKSSSERKEGSSPKRKKSSSPKSRQQMSPRVREAIREACMETAARRCSNGPIENFDQCIADATALCNRI